MTSEPLLCHHLWRITDRTEGAIIQQCERCKINLSYTISKSTKPTDAEMVEVMARAICKVYGNKDPDDKLNEEPLVRAWEVFTDDAKAALQALREKGII